MKGKKKEKIVEGLVSANLISKEEADKLNRHFKVSKDSLEEAVVKQDILQEDKFIEFLSKYLGVPNIDISEFEVPDGIIQLIPEDFAQKSLCIPIKKRGKILGVAMVDPTDIALIDDIKFVTGYEIEPYIVSRRQIKEFMNQHYETKDDIDEIMKYMKDEELEVVKEEEDSTDMKALEAAIEETPVVRYVDSLIAGAIRKGASDIHIEPYEKILRVRTRIDGVLFEEPSPPFKLKNSIISRIKVMATLDLAEHRIPQDGRIKMRLREKEVDLRVSSIPTLYGEKIVMRVLDKSALNVDLEKIGFEKDGLDKFLRAIQAPYGLILVTGPTGSGKTTTLYSALSRINTPDTNIMTAEDPVEYNFVGINQVQMREKVGLTFASALRSFLRQDPDIIMVGEIRDHETASIAIRAALTGHLVLSTLHTNDAPSAISRLLDMEIAPFLVSSSLVLVVAQRLVRKICPKCKEPTSVPRETLLEVGIPAGEIDKITPYYGKGCSECNNGYKGRGGLYEVMTMSPKIKELTLEKASATKIKDSAIKEGMLTLRDMAILKFKKGEITLEEVLRVTSVV